MVCTARLVSNVLLNFNCRRHHCPQHAFASWTPQASAPSLLLNKTRAQAGDNTSYEHQQPHIPVLLDEILGYFDGNGPLSVYVDGTLGAGGHACSVLKKHPELQTIIGFDLDPTAHGIASEKLRALGARVVFANAAGFRDTPATDTTDCSTGRTPATAYLIRGNFSSMTPVLSNMNGMDLYGRVNAMLLDLGISSMQVDEGSRGFSFLRDGPLDMRMDPDAQISAEEVVNTWSEVKLGQIIRDLGEERWWKGIASRIVTARELSPITTTQQLVKAIGTPGGYNNNTRNNRNGREKQKHPATRTFQALRIAVNGELETIAKTLPSAVDALAPGGRLAVITFHSLEDRIVKWAFRQSAGMAPSDEPLPWYCSDLFGGDQGEGQPLAKVKILTKRPIVPSETEQQMNPRSRSAKLRVVERLHHV